WPFFSLQAPVGLQVFVPVQLSGSSPFVMVEQVPRVAPRLQAWQVPVHAVSQQMLSTQCPERQSPAPTQPCPFFPTQAPLPLEARVTSQVPGSSAFLSGLHVPSLPAMLHASHVPQPKLLQQTPSTHIPPAPMTVATHSDPSEQP